MPAPVNVPTTPMPPAQPEMGEWEWSGLKRWAFKGEQCMKDGESVADYIKRIKRNRYQRERTAPKSKPVTKPVAEKVAEPAPKSKCECPICHKSYVNLALHHTKMHATFTCVDDKILKDGVLLTTIDLSDCTGADYSFYETDPDQPGDGKTYRLKIFNSGKMELWLTSCAGGRDGSKNSATFGGVDKTLITNKITMKK